MQLKYIKIKDLFIQIINNERKSECIPIKYISFDLIWTNFITQVESDIYYYFYY